jgi:hypothetical protein
VNEVSLLGKATELGSKGAVFLVEPMALSVSQFCQLHGISRVLLYKLWKQGIGPRVMQVAGRTLVSRESTALWRREMEAASRQPGQGAEAGES